MVSHCRLICRPRFACQLWRGGGGGTTTPTPTPTTVTVICPNGASKATATLDLATAQCATPALVSVSPANGSTAVAVDSFASIDVVTDSTLDASSITNATVTLKAGTTAVAGTASAVGAKGFKFVPTEKLRYSQAYLFSATVKDTLGKSLAVSIGFTTAQGCIAPLFWNAGVKICESPMAIPLIGANQLAQGCSSIAQQCWKDAIANGTVKAIASGATDGAGQAVIFVFFQQPPAANTYTTNGVTTTEPIAGAKPIWIIYPLRSSDGATTTDSAGVPVSHFDSTIDQLGNGWGTEVVAVWGSQNGAIFKLKVDFQADYCGEYFYNKATNQWNSTMGPSFPCPSL